MPLTGINHDCDFSSVAGRAFAWPTRRTWIEAGGIACVFGLIAVPFGLTSGLLQWQPAAAAGLLPVMLVAFFAPALLEEIVFRGPLLLLAGRPGRAMAAIFLLCLFILWHPLNGTYFLTDAGPLFSDMRFLMIAAGLGITCTLITLRSNSLWPAILFHWLVVVAWKGLFGGPDFLTGAV
ncbi:type II CAAX prenyl endopeptidase Rce1 family protein [Parvularcula sp. IMCC14364]|uniref:CPBP family glutamic-type intramembrane protease n=1 Tax=Parvularcula sp. IMCC14364 TaxID=3067902 RepID=UPI002741EE06|nr:CPBP family glutamic-type intramembrane protease [Parvularcula sp. IMCC14364]